MTDLLNIGSGVESDQFYRYKMPAIEVAIFKNNTTAITNLEKISKTLDRDPSHILKWVGYSLKSNIIPKKNAIYGKHDKKVLQTVLQEFISSYILCKVCGNPETKYIWNPKKTQLGLTCVACGKKSKVKKSSYTDYLLKKMK